MENDEQNAKIVWRAPAFRHYPKDVSWYWLTVLAAVFLFFFAVWQKNFLFGIFVILAEIAVFTLARRQPEMLGFKIDERGIEIAEKFYAYDELTTFCLRPDNEDNNFQELILKKKVYFNPYITILIDNKIVSQARDIIGQKLTEEQYQDSLLDVLFRWLKF